VSLVKPLLYYSRKTLYREVVSVYVYVYIIFKCQRFLAESIYTIMKCWVVAWFLAVKGFWALWENIFECVCCYNRCNVNTLRRSYALWDNIFKTLLFYISRNYKLAIYKYLILEIFELE
jgi:hypothetical protein